MFVLRIQRPDPDLGTLETYLGRRSIIRDRDMVSSNPAKAVLCRTDAVPVTLVTVDFDSLAAGQEISCVGRETRATTDLRLFGDHIGDPWLFVVSVTSSVSRGG